MPSLLGASYRLPLDLAVRAALVLLVFPGSARGQPATQRVAQLRASAGESRTRAVKVSKTILVVRSNGDEAAIEPVRTELRIRGWRIIEVRDKSLASAEQSLGPLVAEQHAAAALRVNRSAEQVELYVARPSGDVQEAIRTGGNTIDGNELALRVTEILRAHGLDFGTARAQEPVEPSQASEPPEKQADKPPSAPNQRNVHAAAAVEHEQAMQSAHSEAPPRNRGVWFELAPAMLESAGGWRTQFAIWAGARLAPTPDWSVALTGVAPLTSDSVSGTGGKANVKTTLLGLSIATSLFRRSFGSSSLGLGAMLLATSMRGSAQPGYVDKDDLVLTQAPFVYLRAAAVLHRDWQCFTTLLGGVSIPEVEVAFAGNIQRTWGRPFALLSVGLETRALSW